MFLFLYIYNGASKKKQQTNRYYALKYYTEACNEWGVHLDLVPGQHSFEESSQRWRAVSDIVSDLTCPVIEPQICRSGSSVFRS